MDFIPPDLFNYVLIVLIYCRSVQGSLYELFFSVDLRAIDLCIANKQKLTSKLWESKAGPEPCGCLYINIHIIFYIASLE